MTKRIPVHDPDFPNAPLYAIVDDEDYERLAAFRWTRLATGAQIYAKRTSGQVPGQSDLMHKILTGFTRTGHSNGIGLDNRRANLEDVTHSQNLMNRGAQKNSRTSKFKGVSWDKSNNRWVAFIKVEGVRRNLGLFTVEEDAARAYDDAARIHFGVHGRYNFPLPGERSAIN